MASIHKRVTAKGEIRWLVRYRDPNKVERTRSFRLKTDAARFAAAVETDIFRGDWVNPELARETFSYWADQWLAATYHLKPKTQEGYRSVLNHHLLPRLANTPVARIDVLGSDGRRLGELARDLPTWKERFSLVDSFLLARMDQGPRPSPEVSHALTMLVESDGRRPIGQLAADTGWSHKHLITRFKRQVGLAPKMAARLIRFENVRRHLAGGSLG